MGSLIDYLQANLGTVFGSIVMKKYITINRLLNNYIEVSMTVTTRDSKFESLLEHLLKTTKNITVKYSLDEDLKLVPTIDYLDHKVDFKGYLLIFTVSEKSSDIKIIARSKILQNTQLLEKINIYLQENTTINDIKAIGTNEVCIILNDSFNNTIKSRVISEFIKPRLPRSSINTNYTMGNASGNGAEMVIKNDSFGLYLYESDCTIPHKKTLIERFDDIAVYVEANTKGNIIRLYAHSDKYTSAELMKKVFNKITSFLEEKTETDSKPVEIELHVYQYKVKDATFAKTGCLLNKPVKVFLNKDIQASIDNIIERLSQKRSIFDILGIPKKCGILLYGPPGTGKTTTIKYLAQLMKKSVYMINLLDVTSNAKLDAIFDQVKTSDGIIVIEDIDRHIHEAFNHKTEIIEFGGASDSDGSDYRGSLLMDSDFESNSDSDSDDEKKKDSKKKDDKKDDKKKDDKKDEDKKDKKKKKSKHHKKSTISFRNEQLTFDGIMNRLDGLQSTSDQVFVMTSNRANIIKEMNPAFLRPGRIDYCLNIDFCDREQLFEIVKYLFKIALSDEDLLLFQEKKYATVTVVYALAYYLVNKANTESVTMENIVHIIEKYDGQTSSAIEVKE